MDSRPYFSGPLLDFARLVGDCDVLPTKDDAVDHGCSPTEDDVVFHAFDVWSDDDGPARRSLLLHLRKYDFDHHSTALYQ